MVPHIGGMAEPFVEPQEPSAVEAIAAIREVFEFLDDDTMRYTQLIDFGRALPAFPEGWQDEAHLVPGCLAKVWMESELSGGRLLLAGASNAAIVSGLVALLLRVYSGRTPAEVLATDMRFVNELGMAGLSSNRGNGVVAMMKRIREIAAAAG